VEETHSQLFCFGVQVVADDDILGRRRRRRVDDATGVDGREQTALRRPESHLLSTSCLRVPTAAHRLRARDDMQIPRRHGDPGRQLK